MRIFGIKETINNLILNNSLDYDELLLFKHACLEDVTEALRTTYTINIVVDPYKNGYQVRLRYQIAYSAL